MKHQHAIAYFVIAAVIVWIFYGSRQGGIAYTNASYAATTT